MSCQSGIYAKKSIDQKVIQVLVFSKQKKAQTRLDVYLIKFYHLNAKKIILRYDNAITIMIKYFIS